MRVKYLAQEHNAVPRPGLEPGVPDPESSALTIRPPRLPLMPSIEINKFKKGLLGFEEQSSCGHTRRPRFGHYGGGRSLKFLSISSKIKIDLNRKSHHVYCL